MSDFPRWKYALVVLAMLFGIVYALPNAFTPLKAVQVSANKGSAPAGYPSCRCRWGCRCR